MAGSPASFANKRESDVTISSRKQRGKKKFPDQFEPGDMSSPVVWGSAKALKSSNG
jgi:hypothetical protein